MCPRSEGDRSQNSIDIHFLAHSYLQTPMMVRTRLALAISIRPAYSQETLALTLPSLPPRQDIVAPTRFLSERHEFVLVGLHLHFANRGPLP